MYANQSHLYSPYQGPPDHHTGHHPDPHSHPHPGAMAYMAYQDHTAAAAAAVDHSNSIAQSLTQSGAASGGPQSTSAPYSVDPYGQRAMTAADYSGYGNYNHPYFQAPPPPLVGNPGHAAHSSPVDSQYHWSHPHMTPAQHRVGQNQGVTQAPGVPQIGGSVQQQQRSANAAPDQSNYMHDPSIYYGRPSSFSQNMQHFGQVAQQHLQLQQQQHQHQQQQQQHQQHQQQQQQQQDQQQLQLQHSQHSHQHPNQQPGPQESPTDSPTKKKAAARKGFGARKKRDPKDVNEGQRKSGYAQFFSDKQKEIKILNPKITFADISRTVSIEWQSLSDQDKKKYNKGVTEKRRESLSKKAAEQAKKLQSDFSA